LSQPNPTTRMQHWFPCSEEIATAYFKVGGEAFLVAARGGDRGGGGVLFG